MCHLEREIGRGTWVGEFSSYYYGLPMCGLGREYGGELGL
jgi:hypothetical protein